MLCQSRILVTVKNDLEIITHEAADFYVFVEGVFVAIFSKLLFFKSFHSSAATHTGSEFCQRCILVAVAIF